jgi:hypothetical protein
VTVRSAMEATVITLVRAALQWLGFIDLSAAPPQPIEVWPEDLEPDIPLPPDVHISLGVFLLTRCPTRA